MDNSEEDELEIGPTNFHDGDKSLWTKTVGNCYYCKGSLWILTTHFKQKGLNPTDMIATCGGCGMSGNCDAMLGFDDDFTFAPPAESCP